MNVFKTEATFFTYYMNSCERTSELFSTAELELIPMSIDHIV